MQSSYSSSHQERKESSSSSVTKTLGEQSVTSVSESQSSQSQQKSSVVSAGQLSYGDHGQAVFTGIKKEASSSESHEKSSSSSQRISSSNGAVTGKCKGYFEDIAGSIFLPIFEDFSERGRASATGENPNMFNH